MRKVFILFCILNSFILKGSENAFKDLQLGLSASGHLFVLSESEVTSKFKNKITPSGSFVYNPVIQFSKSKIEDKHYKKHTALFFMDCVGKPSLGYAYSLGKKFERAQFGFVLGGYFLNRKEWDKVVTRKQAHYFVVSDSLGLTPLLGLELNLRAFQFSEKVDLNFNNFLSLVFVSHSLALSYRF